MKTSIIKPFSNGSLRVKFETLSKNLLVLSKAIEPEELDSPEQFILWGVISQLQDLESHYEQLSACFKSGKDLCGLPSVNNRTEKFCENQKKCVLMYEFY